MAHVTDHIIDTITIPVGKRPTGDVEVVTLWLKRRVQMLQNVDKATLSEIVQFCHYETASRDDVIVQQGDHGDKMFIILRGSALVYIDTSLSGEEETYVSSPLPSPGRDYSTSQGSPDGKKRNRALDRSKYGRYIMRYDSGNSFGEPALLAEDKARNATVVADESCDFLVIDQELFDRGLKEVQEQEYAEIRAFVDTHVFFRHMSPKFKHLLELSLRKEMYPFDSVIIKQGDPASALYFIKSGHANMFVEPGYYAKQYPHMWPFEAGIDIYSQEFEWLRESRRNAILRKYEDPAVWPTKSEHLVVKRTEGYAAAEKRVQERSLCLCSIREGEVLGDLEVSSKLASYTSTVWCTSPVTAIVLDIKNLERVVGKRNPVTMDIIKATAMEKLSMRIASHQGKDVVFLNFLHHKLTEERLPSAKKLPPIKATKQLPAKDIQVLHLLEKFKEGEAQLIEPIIPGALIYKDQMKEKARIRANLRGRGTMGVSAMLREARRKMNRRQPRSRREIVESLREMMESDLVEYTKPVGISIHPADLPPRKAEQTETKNLTPITSRKNSLVDNATLKNVRFDDKNAASKPTIGSKSNTPRKAVNIGPKGPELVTPRKQNPKGNIIKPSPPNNQITKKEHTPTIPSAPTFEKNSSLNLPAIAEAPREISNLTSATISRDMSADPIPEDQPHRSASSSRLEYKRTEVQATSKSPTRLPPLAKPELKRPENVPQNKWQSALQFVNERINDRFTKQLLDRGPGCDDYETSEASLNMLENRIRTFFTKQVEAKQDLKLPPLARFKVDLEDTDVNLPKPGGKVWIRKRLCRFANSEVKVKNHEHVRYHMVPELPQFDDVKKTRVIMHNLLSQAASTSNTPSTSPQKMLTAGKSFVDT